MRRVLICLALVAVVVLPTALPAAAAQDDGAVSATNYAINRKRIVDT